MEQAWLEAVADVRGESRAEVVRQAITSYCVRETERVQRTRHYAVIAYLAKQEGWNPVDEHLRAQPEGVEVPQSVELAFKRALGAGAPAPRVLTEDLLYIGPERRLTPR